MKKNPYSGKFIVFEGIDGSGKSTQAKLFSDYLEKAGNNIVLTREHTREGKWGRKIEQVQRQEIKSPNSPAKFQEWYIKDRLSHLTDAVIPALERGDIVVSDRYWFSTLAYGIAGGIKLADFIKMHKSILKEKFILPDITFIIDIPMEIAIERIADSKREKSLFDKKIIFLKRVRFIYLELAKRYKNIYVIDGNGPISNVFKNIIKTYYKHELLILKGGKS